MHFLLQFNANSFEAVHYVRSRRHSIRYSVLPSVIQSVRPSVPIQVVGIVCLFMPIPLKLYRCLGRLFEENEGT